MTTLLRFILGTIVVAAIIATVWFFAKSTPQPGVSSPVLPASAPATRPATMPARPPPPAHYMDVVRLAHPGFPTTQPLGVPVELSEAARLVFADPIHLDQQLQLWITRADAEPTPAVLRAATTQPTHVIREQVVFVHRWPDEKGVWQPYVVVRDDDPDAGFELVQAGGRQPLPDTHGYLWDRAFSWNDVIVVPTRTGVSIVRPDRRPLELHHEFRVDLAAGSNVSWPQVLLDWRGVIAWMPWEDGKFGSEGAIRFVDGKWIDLAGDSGWPRKLLHLVPLLDGGVLRLESDDAGAARVTLAALDPPAVDQKLIAELVTKLSDADPEVRKGAFSELTRYGTGAWDVLERVAPEQPPEGKRRIEELLATKHEPALGGMTLMPGVARVVARSRHGGAILVAESGVSMPTHDDLEPRIVAPAWLMILPGRAIQLAPDGLVRDNVPGKTHLHIVGQEILTSDDVQGPRLWLSNHFSHPLLKKSELAFRHIVGFDARGRWLFRKSPDEDHPTLVIDPTLPDPTPRLPVWDYPVAGGSAGWTRDGWPAIRRGGAWVLTERQWRALNESKEEMITEHSPPPERSPATTQADEPIFIDTDGTRYYDGRAALRVVRPDGSELTWALPSAAIGTFETVWLVRAGEDRLFLFNAPGRVLRIKRTPEGTEPFELEATFTRGIPSLSEPIRVWLDPAGRINMIAEPDELLIMFPTGRIPRHIAEMMPAERLGEEE